MNTPVESTAGAAAAQVFVKPMTIHIGAEISGIDLRQSLIVPEDVYDSDFEREFFA